MTFWSIQVSLYNSSKVDYYSDVKNNSTLLQLSVIDMIPQDVAKCLQKKLY